jgi:polysaccharide biosynthesis/export protein
MHRYRPLLFFILLLNLSSCKVFYPNWMLRENRENYYFEIAKQQSELQLISIGDKLNFIMKARDGYELVDVLEANNSALAAAQVITYLVREDGNCEFPLLGDIKVTGYTRKQLEDLLEKKYSNLYNDPFIILNVSNRRAFVFMGVGGGSVVQLPNENTKLIELLALVGGIPAGAKSSKIRIIRGDYRHPNIKKIDLSTIEGLKDCDFVIQPDDLIVVDPTTKVAPAILNEIAPFLSLFSTILTIYLVIKLD